MGATTPDTRRCARCNAILAGDNKAGICRPCQRAARDVLISPPDVPPEFWDDEGLRDALIRERHIGHALRCYRHHPYHGLRPIPQEIAAQWFNISQTQLYRIETGRRTDDLGRLIQWAKILRIPQDLLWFTMPGEAPKGHAATSAENEAGPAASTVNNSELPESADDVDEGGSREVIGHENPETDPMRRRSFVLTVAALAGLGAADTPAAIEATRHELNLSLIEERADADTGDWQEIALEYGESYPVAPPADLMRSLMVDVIGMQSALQRNSSIPVQRDLLRIAALLSAFTAQTVTNLGQPSEAGRWWRTSKNAADRSGDTYSALWIRSQEIVRAMENRPVPAILQLIEEAEGISRQSPPEATLLLSGGKAQTLALAGRNRESTEALHRLREQSNKSFSGYNGSILSWGEERLYNTESFSYSRLGDFTKCEAATTNGLKLYAANGVANVRWSAQLQMNLAFCLVRNGDVTTGVGHARTVITGIPEEHRGTTIDSGKDLLTAIPASCQNAAGVQEYREWINSLSRDKI